MKISRRNFLKSSAFVALAATTTSLLGCADDAIVVSSDATTTATAAPTAVPDPTAEPEPTTDPALDEPYYVDVLTGEQRDPDDVTYRITGIMINNIAGSTYQNARPQRGLSSASVITEIKVEGSITRFCAMYNDLNTMPEVGPIRSGRDQFLQLVMPYEGIYYHDGESYYCTLYVYTWEYSMYNFGGKTYVFDVETHSISAHRDSRGGNVASEHTEFVYGSEVQNAVDNAGVEMEHDYGDTTYFKFADYRTGEYISLDGYDDATAINIYHSSSYRTYFDYDATSKEYMMGQYSAASCGVNSTASNASTGLYTALSSGGYVHTTVDELTGEQLGFTNVVVIFTLIDAYAGDSGDVQCVEYSLGGDGYYFTNGKAKKIRWMKGGSTTQIRILTPGEDFEDCVVNTGKTYMAIVDNDEEGNFSFNGGSTIAAI